MKDCKIEKNDVSITCFKRDMGWGIDFGMNVNFPEWMTNEWIHENREMVKKVALYTANKIEMQVLTDAVSFMKETKSYGLEVEERDGVWIFYDGGKSAFIRPFIFQNKIDINPFVEFNSVNEHGFTLTPGSFSDFIITTRTFDKRQWGYTKDFFPTHFGIATLYLLHYCENLEKFILKKDIPSDFDEYAVYHFRKMNDVGREITTQIRDKIDALCSVNKSTRIDTLIVNKKNIYDLMREHDMQSSFDVRGVSLLQMAIALGKTVFQVEKFVKKYIDRKRAS